MARPYPKLGSSLWTHTNPIEPRGWVDCSVRLNRHRKAAAMQRVEQTAIDLQQWFPTSKHGETMMSARSPFVLYDIDEVLCGGIRPTARAVEADEVGITEPTL